MKPQIDPCENGVPAGEKVSLFTEGELNQINLIGAKLEEVGPNGTPDAFEIKLSNNSSKCLSKVEFEITLASNSSNTPGQQYVVHVTRRITLGPGWGWTNDPYSFSIRQEVLAATDPRHTFPDLVSWKVAKAWGFVLPELLPLQRP